MAAENFYAAEKKTTSGIYLDNLTGIRAIAVLWVLIFHTWGIARSNVRLNIPFTDIRLGITRIIEMGEWGVDIFFVLSGVLLTTPFIKNGLEKISTADIRKFYFRRALRILPAYQFTLLALIYIFLFGLQPLPAAIDVFQSALLINPLFATPPLQAAFWSLPVEALFYMFLPPLLMAAIYFRSFLIIFIALIPLTIAFRIFVINSPIIESKGLFLFSFFGRMDQFAIGAICAYWIIRRPLTARQGLIALAGGTIGLIFFASFIGWRGSNIIEKKDYLYYFFQTIVGLIAAVMIYGAASPSRLGTRILGNRFMIFIGTISYSIYLWHTIILDIYTSLGISNSPSKHLITALYTWPPILIISFLSYLFIERPFLNIRHDSQQSSKYSSNRYLLALLFLAPLALALVTALAKFTQTINH